MKKKFDILTPLLKTQNKPEIIDFVEKNRNFLAIWVFAAMLVDHDSFFKCIWQAIANYKTQRGDAEDIKHVKANNIHPMTYAKHLVIYGKCILHYSGRISKNLKFLNRVKAESEH